MTSNLSVDRRNAPSGNVRRGVAGAVVALVLGTLLALLGSGGIIGGVASALVASRQGPDGYFVSPTRAFATNSYALSTPPAQIEADSVPFDLGSLRISAAFTAPDGQVFIGVGAKADVEKYLSGVHSTQIIGIKTSPFRVSYSDVPGSAVPTPPAEQSFWAKQASGSGTQQITTDLRSGDWVVVVMNADASAGVTVNMQAGFRSELFGTLTPALFIGGVALVIIGAGLIAIGAVGLGRRVSSSKNAQAAGLTGELDDSHRMSGAGPLELAKSGPMPSAGITHQKLYPASLSGELDPQLSRGLWLVKWLLAIPHYIVLFFLWFAVLVTTLVAGITILFTGRYPLALFNFAVGVLRWNWRVTFYAYSALATDKYPPFTLASADYPADFEVDYPQQLSHGLVLVKWWLLAFPHLLIVGMFSSAAWPAWSLTDTWSSDYYRAAGLSLLGVLVLIAAIMLLFTGRYPRALFDLIMGVNRWIYRVATYVLLLRDEYPPFRLDQGPQEPADSAVG
ncbi:DUF4389 domain-containing protein [Paeniglutamicibacter antarcticus]|uniref:DUF4389 domain-containing protein n=1 Tax=Arthrobacter terrae TaxID=2935737 RepID=A0A931CKX1_9MICC|nr:DUF4389 domain-containing protein [Arthrobacter terrae]MBG0738035.1 DUF4389 domain-containing protein [Arthrobacter terrae]